SAPRIRFRAPSRMSPAPDSEPIETLAAGLSAGLAEMSTVAPALLTIVPAAPSELMNMRINALLAIVALPRLLVSRKVSRFWLVIDALPPELVSKKMIALSGFEIVAFPPLPDP